MRTPRSRWVIGLTGGIATGKTSVLREMKRRGLHVVSSDDLAHECLKHGHPCYSRITRHFGDSILRGDAQIDRKRLGKIIFDDPRQRRWLEKQVHPWVVRELKSYIRKHRGWLVLDIPLLFEAGLQNLADANVVVVSSRAQQIKRLQRRNGLQRSEALKRIRAQWPLSMKKTRADYVIVNETSLPALSRQVATLLENLKKRLN